MTPKGNETGGAVVYRSMAAEFAAYEALPRELRSALAFAPLKMASPEVLAAYRRHGLAPVLKAIQATMAAELEAGR